MIDPIEQLRHAVEDKGLRPDVHDAIMRRHRSEWPTLWAAIDRILDTAPSTDRGALPGRDAILAPLDLRTDEQRDIDDMHKYAPDSTD